VNRGHETSLITVAIVSVAICARYSDEEVD